MYLYYNLYYRKKEIMNYNSTFIVDTKRIKKNLDKILNNISDTTQVIPVLKANAYGHGLIGVAEVFEDYPQIQYIAIAHPFEAIQLKQAHISKKIMLVCAITQPQLEEMVDHKIELLLHDYTSITKIREYLLENNISNYPVHLKINTGLNRLGFKPESLLDIIDLLKDDVFSIQSVYTHFIEGAKVESNISYKQKERFDQAIEILDTQNVPYGFKHMCDSGAYEWFKEAHYDAIRIGRALYMDNPYKEDRFKDAGSWEATLLSKRKLNEGESIGYGQAFTASKEMDIGIMNVGYGDGMMILDSNIKRYTLIRDKKAPILSIAMDQTYLDITDIDAEIGDTITIFGSTPTNGYLSTHDTTKQFDDEGCTLTTLISNRVKRKFIK